MWKNNWLAITPNVNLISNIGFGGDGTHIVGESEFSKMKTYELKLTTHPKSVVQDKEADEVTTKRVFLPKPLLIRGIKKVLRILKI
jgi:hypothetical protein